MSSDEELALKLQQGGSEAMTTLIERHYDALIGYLYRLSGGDRALAEDIVQDVFMRLIRAIHHYEYPRPFKAWLYAIATNLVRNHYNRSETRHSISAEEPVIERQLAQQPAESMLDDDDSRHVIALLNALPDQQREVVILRYYQELSLAEIAQLLDIPVGTVKSRLSIGLSRLRTLAEQESL